MALNPPIMFYCLKAYLEYNITGIMFCTIDECLLCNNTLKKKSKCYVQFIYYDYPEQTETDYYFEMCMDCFLNKIVHKPLKELKWIIPLLKIKGRVHRIPWTYMDISRLENPPRAVDAPIPFYRIDIPNEEKEEYYEKAKDYTKGWIFPKWQK